MHVQLVPVVRQSFRNSLIKEQIILHHIKINYIGSIKKLHSTPARLTPFGTLY